jgi:hypothetical protein
MTTKTLVPSETFLSARALAHHLGIETGTLAKWRYLGKGPQGWFHASETLVVYPLSAVETWKAERAASRRSRGFRPKEALDAVTSRSVDSRHG